MRRRRSIAGITLIEILVTLVIIALGLLGLGAFQMRTQQAGLEAYNRARPLVLLDAIVNRVNANRQTAPCYAIATAGAFPYSVLQPPATPVGARIRTFWKQK
jgi:type IV pilus assembly protein PilV